LPYRSPLLHVFSEYANFREDASTDDPAVWTMVDSNESGEDKQSSSGLASPREGGDSNGIRALQTHKLTGIQNGTWTNFSFWNSKAICFSVSFNVFYQVFVTNLKRIIIVKT